MGVFIQVEYEYTSDLNRAKQWLAELSSPFSCDFEVSSRYDTEAKEKASRKLNETQNWYEQCKYQQIVKSDGFSPPSLCFITHLSIAWSNHEARVFVLDTEPIRKLVCEFLTSTDLLQIWHNFSYDSQFIQYYTGKLPKNFDDTMLMVKTLTNNVLYSKDDSKLKHLEGSYYGNWAISKDNFVLEEIHNENVIKYNAIDACATYHLYERIQEELSKWKIQ